MRLSYVQTKTLPSNGRLNSKLLLGGSVLSSNKFPYLRIDEENMYFSGYRGIEKMSQIMYNIRDILQEVVLWIGGYMKQIRERILSAEDGTVFATSDFADIADSATVRQSLNRLVQAEILRRVLRGFFEKPKYCSDLNKFVAVNPDAVAKTLARTYHWTVTPYRTYEWDSIGLSSSTEQIKSSSDCFTDFIKIFFFGN